MIGAGSTTWTRFVLGWSNHEKRAAVERELQEVERQAQDAATTLSCTASEEQRLRQQLDALKAVAAHRSFDDLDWRWCVATLERLTAELEALETTSDVLRALEQQLRGIEKALATADARLTEARDERTRADALRVTLERTLARTVALVEATTPEERARFSGWLRCTKRLGRARP